MRYQFIYNSKESRYAKLETYYVYDVHEKKYVHDVYNNVCCVALDRDNKTIYFYGMHVDYHWILDKFFYEIILEFLNLSDAFNVLDYTIDKDCVGGKIYYNNNK